MALLALMTVTTASAQSDDSQWTLNTRAWSTNYFTTMIGAAANFLITGVILDSNGPDSVTIDRIVPLPALVFPVGMKKDGFDEPYNIYGPYHRAFSNPFKHIGDYAVGLDISYQPSVIGFYAGAYFKSQEIVYKNEPRDGDNIRGFYFQPRAGLSFGGTKSTFEAGIFYDIPTGCTSTGPVNPDKNILKEGLGLDFAFTNFDKNDPSSLTLQFSMPLHDMFKENCGPGFGKRRVGYIMLTRRIKL